jgi:thiamine-phosphate pyrophosphorylase
MGKEIIAMKVLDQFNAARLYVITCPPPTGIAGYAPMVEAACVGGADVVQFRDKTLSWKQRYEVASDLRKICRSHGVLFIVNDAVDLALAVQADGVHLGQDDLPYEVARVLIVRAGVSEFLLGRSTHSLEQALQAEREGADYIGVGPVFSTPTKPSYVPVGLDLVRKVTSQVKTPQVAIGGIDATNVEQVLNAGAKRVAIVRAVCGAASVEQAARSLKLQMEKMQVMAR